MSLRPDVLKGVRLAAILFAVLLCAVTIRRMVHIAPVEDRDVPPPPPASSASPAPAQWSAPASAFPPPPPVRPQIHRIARKRTPAVAARPTPAAQEGSVDFVAENESGSTAVPTGETQALEVAFNDVQSEDPAPVSAPEPAARPRSGGKRWLKAVGRFLHIGQKETPAQTVR